LAIFIEEICEQIVIECASLDRPIEEAGNKPGAVRHEVKRPHPDSII